MSKKKNEQPEGSLPPKSLVWPAKATPHEEASRISTSCHLSFKLVTSLADALLESFFQTFFCLPFYSCLTCLSSAVFLSHFFYSMRLRLLCPFATKPNITQPIFFQNSPQIPTTPKSQRYQKSSAEWETSQNQHRLIFCSRSC